MAAQLERRIQRLRFRLALEFLLETLQQALADAQHQRGTAIEALHHPLDIGIVGLVLVGEARRKRALVVEAQALLALAGDHVQAPAQALQLTGGAQQGVAFVRADLAHRLQLRQTRHAMHADRHPAQRLQVTQSAGAFLDIGLEVVRGIAEARVPAAQLLALAVEVVGRRPHVVHCDDLLQCGHRGCVACQLARIHQRGLGGDVGTGRLARGGQRAHRMRGLYASVPQQGNETRDVGFMRGLRGFIAHDQQIDI